MSAAARGSSVVMYLIDVLPTSTYNTSLLGNAINTENTFPSVRSFRQTQYASVVLVVVVVMVVMVVNSVVLGGIVEY